MPRKIEIRSPKERAFYNFRGAFFEAVAKKLIEKAGFYKYFESDERTPTKFYGRGARHQIDIWGEFCFSIPFVYPLNILGEVKARGYTYPVRLPDVRNFVSAVEDIRQWYRIDLIKRGKDQYLPITKLRHMHCPVYFSLSGFTKEAEQFMYAHGVYPITYKDNPEIKKIFNAFNRVIKNIDYRKNIKRSYKTFFKSIETIEEFPSELRTINFKEKLHELEKRLDAVKSHFGMLGKKYLINILGREFSTNSRKKVVIKFEDGIFKVGKGYFSLTKNFLKYNLYNIYRIREVFSEIDVILLDNKRQSAQLIKLEIDPNCLGDLSKNIRKYLDNLKKNN